MFIITMFLAHTFNLDALKITSLCDNRGALSRLGKIYKDIRFANHKEAEADLLLTYQEWVKNGLVKQSSPWVMGHQDNHKAQEYLAARY